MIRSAHRQIEAALRNDLIERVLQRDPRFFETLILNVLLAMGMDPAAARGSLRFSLGHTSTRADVEALGKAIGPAVERARSAGLSGMRRSAVKEV